MFRVFFFCFFDLLAVNDKPTLNSFRTRNILYLYFIPLIFYTSYYRKNEETLNGKLLVSAMFETNLKKKKCQKENSKKV